jgi:TonB family protein
MLGQLRGVCEAGFLLVALIGSAQCSSTSPKASVEPSCKQRAQPPEVRSGPGCKEVESPVLLECVDPDYPPDVRKDRLSGKVVATATLYPDARLGGVTVVSSPSEVLSKLALEAFRQWRYKPAFCRDLGKPIEVTITMTTTFSLH